jgi:hypothetical protein
VLLDLVEHIGLLVAAAVQIMVLQVVLLMDGAAVDLVLLGPVVVLGS